MIWKKKETHIKRIIKDTINLHEKSKWEKLRSNTQIHYYQKNYRRWRWENL